MSMFTGHQRHLTQATAMKNVTECAYTNVQLSLSSTKENHDSLNNSMGKLQNT